MLQRCAEHVAVELPNERTRVGYLIENINCNDKDVTTAVSHVRLSDGPGGMRGDFELAVAFLLPTDPVKRKKSGAKRGSAQISAAHAARGDDKASPGSNNGKGKFKPNVGKTGVEFRYYKPKEFSKLTKEQKKELTSHRKSSGDYRGTWTGKGTGKTNAPEKGTGMSKADVSALIREHDEKK